MRALLISEQVKQEVRKVVEYAEAHPQSLKELKLIAAKQKKPIGFNRNHVLEIPMGFLTVFSIEVHPIGTVRHLSVSVDAPDRLPHTVAVQAIMQLFGFKGTIEDCIVYKEEFEHRGAGINIIEFVK